MSKAQRLMQSSFFGTIEIILATVISLFMMPFSIFHLGERMYGLWILVGSFSGFYGLFDFGLSSAVQRYWSRALGSNDHEEANHVFNSSLAYFSFIGCCVFIISLIIAALAPVFFKDIGEMVIFRKMIIIVGFGLALGFPMRTFWASFAVHFKSYLNSYVSLAQLIVRTILIVIFLLKGHKLLAFTTIIIATDIAAYLILSALALKIAPYIKITFKHVKFPQIKKMFSYSVFTFIGQVASNINAASDNFVITGFIGLQAIPIYSVAGRLCGYYWQLMEKILGSTMPVFSELEAQNNFDAIRDRFWFFTKISGYAASLIAAVLVIFGKPFILCWMGEKYIFSYTLLLLLTTHSLVTLSQLPAQQLLFGISKHQLMAFINVGTAILNLVISIVLAPKYGLVGIALGTCISALIGKLLFLPIYVSKQLSVPARDYFMHFFKTIFISLLIVTFEGIVIHSYIEPNYFSIGLLALIFALIFAALILFTGFSDQEREYLIRVFRRRNQLAPSMTNVNSGISGN